MMLVRNPFADQIDFIEETSAGRIGRRIKDIRTMRGYSQADLGGMVGLTADRIQKYENGARKPKQEMLNKIAYALGVGIDALEDPTPASNYNVMHTLFEMEAFYGLKIKREDKKICLYFDNNSLNNYLEEWYEKYLEIKRSIDESEKKEEKEELAKEYFFWKAEFPKALSDRTEKSLKKARIKAKIKELQEELKNLEDE